MKPIDLQSVIPLYYQVKETLSEQIKDGVWQPGDRIPTEVELSKTFQVSRITVRQAVLDLVRQGLLYRKSGLGTFVASPKMTGDYINYFFPEELSDKHEIISINLDPPSLYLSEVLDIKNKEQVFKLVRLRYFKDEPAAIEIAHFRKSLCPELMNERPLNRLFEYLRTKYDVTIERAEAFIEPVVIGEFETKYLGVKKGSPALLLSRRSITSDKVIVLSDSIIRGDRCKLKMSTIERTM